jgi:hypothetical protein
MGALVLGALGAAPAQADGPLPYYGYSDYFGSPATYFEGDGVYQATTPEGGQFGFGTRRYYRGGPFWKHRSHAKSFGRPARGKARRHAVIRRAY